jgi:hypothetical protein
MTYRFSAWVRTKALTSDQGVRFSLRSGEFPGRRPLLTRDVRGSEPWTQIEVLWTAEKDEHAARICVSRSASGKFDNEIQGTAWVDDVALIPATAGTAKP